MVVVIALDLPRLRRACKRDRVAQSQCIAQAPELRFFSPRADERESRVGPLAMNPGKRAQRGAHVVMTLEVPGAQEATIRTRPGPPPESRGIDAVANYPRAVPMPRKRSREEFRWHHQHRGASQHPTDGARRAPQMVRRLAGVVVHDHRPPRPPARDHRESRAEQERPIRRSEHVNEIARPRHAHEAGAK